MSWYPLAESIVRLVAAIFCGALIGLEREKRFKNAGIRTHVIVALASALMMIVSKYGFFDVLSLYNISSVFLETQDVKSKEKLNITPSIRPTFFIIVILPTSTMGILYIIYTKRITPSISPIFNSCFPNI